MKEDKISGYSLSRIWFDWCFENPEKINTNHTALYFFCIEHCNRMGWKEKFGLPTTMAKEAIGIRSYNTYIKTLNDLIEFGFIKLIEKSKNQYSSNIIALSFFNKALDKALDKALIKLTTKQRESTVQSTDSIDKQETINNKQITLPDFVAPNFSDPFRKWMEHKKGRKESYKSLESEKAFYNRLIKLSNNNPNTAAEIVDLAMANNWGGIYALKNENNKNNSNTQQQPYNVKTIKHDAIINPALG